LIAVAPRFVEIWDQDDMGRAFQILIDFQQKTVAQNAYD
jgi:hypothetical protein